MTHTLQSFLQPLQNSYSSAQRNFGFVSVLGLTCTLMITWEGLLVSVHLGSPFAPCLLLTYCCSSFQTGLKNGGSAALIWGYLITWLGVLGQGLSIAEMGSMLVSVTPKVNSVLNIRT